jgi:hypothetical protein
MLARQAVTERPPRVASELMSAGALAVVADRNAARLASRNVTAFEDDHLKTALSQLVRGTHACDSAAQDDDPSGHKVLTQALTALLSVEARLGQPLLAEPGLRLSGTQL